MRLKVFASERKRSPACVARGVRSVFDRHVAVEGDLAGPVHCPHGAFSDQRSDAVFADQRTFRDDSAEYRRSGFFHELAPADFFLGLDLLHCERQYFGILVAALAQEGKASFGVVLEAVERFKDHRAYQFSLPGRHPAALRAVQGVVQLPPHAHPAFAKSFIVEVHGAGSLLKRQPIEKPELDKFLIRRIQFGYSVV